MHLPLLPTINNSHTYVNGDVSIDDSAAIAPGVMIQADPDSKIIIASGVCIGMGTIIHAHKGTLEIETGVTLGAGVLIIGTGKIGANACIGATTTIWNSSVDPWQVVPPGSLLGDKGRASAEAPAPAKVDVVLDTENVTEVNGQLPPTNSNQSSFVYPQPTTPENALEKQQPDLPPTTPGVPISGQANLNKLMKTLFPYNKSYNDLPEDSPSE